MNTNPTRPTNEREGNLARPKRPLSAFNLFYRYKRQKVLEAVATNSTVDKRSIICLVEAAPGLECYHPNESDVSSPDTINALRRGNIRRDLEQNMEARDTRTRSHRKNQGAMNGAISFVELGKLMNHSWKNCDDFARSVFNELSQGGRDRYRQLMEEYNAENKGLVFVKAISTKKSKSTKQKSPTKKNEKALPASQNNDLADSYEMAETMLQLTKGTPSNCNEVCEPLTEKNNYAAAPSLLDLLSKNNKFDGGSGVKTMARDSPLPIPNAGSNFSLSQGIGLSQPTNNASSETGEMLMLRVRALEGQLAEQRLLARIRQIEDDMLKRKAREDLLRSVLDNAILHNRATAAAAQVSAAPFAQHSQHSAMQDGLWSLVSASMIHPSVQATQRAAMLSRIVEPQSVMYSKRPPSGLSQSYLSGIPEDCPNKKQRHH